MSTSAPAVDAASSGWHARIDLRLRATASRTVVGHRESAGPLYVQKAFYPEGEVCHLYLLHPPGGVVGGDDLAVSVTMEPQSHALITTPAATKYYRSAGPPARQRQHFRLAPGASLEWLPQETLLFPGSRVQTATDVTLASGAKYIGWEVICLGRPASGIDYETGCLDQSLTLVADGTPPAPLVVERLRWDAGDAVLSAPWGLAGRRAIATLHAYPADRELVGYLRTRLAEAAQPHLCALTLVNGVLVARALADGAEALRTWLCCVWSLLRPAVMGRPACSPRIWST